VLAYPLTALWSVDVGFVLAACQQKRRVRFVTAAALVNELIEAKATRSSQATHDALDEIRVDRIGRGWLCATG